MTAARGNAFVARSGPSQQAVRNAIRSVPPGPRAGILGGSVVTAVSSNGRRNISVSFQGRVKKDLLPALGTTNRTYPGDTDMDVVIEDCVKLWNTTVWDARAGASLLREDVSLRWSGNIVPEPDTEHKTLGEFYDSHTILPHRDMYFGNRPKTFRGFKGEILFLELLIDLQAFEERTQTSAPVQAKGRGRGRPPGKRSADDSSMLHNHKSSAAKRPRTLAHGGGSQLPSTFRPALAAGSSESPADVQPVKLKIATAAFDENHNFELSWETNMGTHSANLRSALIGTAVLSAGKMNIWKNSPR
ncbi:hypothetical protein C8Q77DRAFT_1141061 [Trametes polyzona]|nr:hypothetical protein C8Q77DRAFT_1141061 [Trametes polyzona]